MGSKTEKDYCAHAEWTRRIHSPPEVTGGAFEGERKKWKLQQTRLSEHTLILDTKNPKSGWGSTLEGRYPQEREVRLNADVKNKLNLGNNEVPGLTEENLLLSYEMVKLSRKGGDFKGEGAKSDPIQGRKVGETIFNKQADLGGSILHVRNLILTVRVIRG